MVADEGHVGHAEAVHDVALPQEFVRQAEVAHVAAVDDEVDVVPPVHVVDEVFRLVIPALRVAHGDESDSVFAETGCLYLFDVVSVDVSFPFDAHVVGVVVNQVAGRG